MASRHVGLADLALRTSPRSRLQKVASTAVVSVRAPSVEVVFDTSGTSLRDLLVPTGSGPIGATAEAFAEGHSARSVTSSDHTSRSSWRQGDVADQIQYWWSSFSPMEVGPRAVEVSASRGKARKV